MKRLRFWNKDLEVEDTAMPVENPELRLLCFDRFGIRNYVCLDGKEKHILLHQLRKIVLFLFFRKIVYRLD